MSTELYRLSVQWARARELADRVEIEARIDAILAEQGTVCPACGQDTEEGTCWNQQCPEGFDNI